MVIRRTIGLGAAASSILMVCAGCFSTSEPSASAGEPDDAAARCLTADDADEMADRVLQLVNLERGEAGLPPVLPDPTLMKIAGDYGCKMIEDGFFGHYDPDDGRGPAERAVARRYRFYAVGENLAAGQQTAAEAMRVWMESPSHKSIILDERWTEVGVAVRFGGEHGVYWVQEFGDPAGY